MTAIWPYLAAVMMAAIAVAHGAPNTWSRDLGVVKVQLHARAPLGEMRHRLPVATLELTVWLRRVGGGNVPYGLPHQRQPAVRALVWVDDPEGLHIRVWGHSLLPTSHEVWHPQLVLETPEPGPLVNSHVESEPGLMGGLQNWRLRPYSLRIDLPPGTEQLACFKIYEASFPGHKVAVCLPAEAFDDSTSSAGPDGAAGASDPGAAGPGGSRSRVCEALAPSGRHNASAPALWATIGSPRHADSTRRWEKYYSGVAVRAAHYVTYHVAMGLSGLLLYTDALARHYLRRHPATAPFLRSGHLRLVAWDMPERGHKSREQPGRGGTDSELTRRPLGYNYDQALFAGHALLGLSACGANLAILVTDLDEFLHTTETRQGDKNWPVQTSTCLPQPHAGAREFVSVRELRRYEVTTSKVRPEAESQLWVNRNATETLQALQSRPGSGQAAAGGQQRVARRYVARRRNGGGGVQQGQAQHQHQQPQQHQQHQQQHPHVSQQQQHFQQHPQQHPQHQQQLGVGQAAATARRLQNAAGGPGRVVGRRRVGGGAGRGGGGRAVNASSLAELLRWHPLALYDKRGANPMKPNHNKLIMVPAAEVVAFFVHDSVPRHGVAKRVDVGCLVLLHVTNYWRPRIDASRQMGLFFLQRNHYVAHSWETSPMRRHFAPGHHPAR